MHLIRLWKRIGVDYEAEISSGYDAICVCLEVGETVFFVPFVGDLIVFYDV